MALLDAVARARGGRRPRRAGALAIYLPLVRQTLDNARAGHPAALTGPLTRGDAGTVDAHLAALRAHAPDASTSIAPSRTRVGLAEARGALTPEGATARRFTCKGRLTR